jgi:hypothetical protein
MPTTTAGESAADALEQIGVIFYSMNGRRIDDGFEME